MSTDHVAAAAPLPELDGAILPEYGGRCVSNLLAAVTGASHDRRWLPPQVGGATVVVVLVLDGLGWAQLVERAALAPTLTAMQGGAITTVAPSTTATALCSITTGSPPAVHGLLGYRLRHEGEIMNVLRWRTPAGDARQSVPPDAFQRRRPFLGGRAAVVTRAEFAETGFTVAHLREARFSWWRAASSIAVEAARLVDEGERLVYAYYDGLDVVAHQFGLGSHYDAELVAIDRLVAGVLERLPVGAALVVTADHGQVHVGHALRSLGDDLLGDVQAVSGEGRFLWLHVAEERRDAVVERARRQFRDTGDAWVVERDETAEVALFGGPLPPELAARVGDVALIARRPIAFVDPGDPGASRLVCRHGSLTEDEMLVPLLGWAG